MYGDRRPYVLHFYLEDDTVEINEVGGGWRLGVGLRGGVCAQEVRRVLRGGKLTYVLLHVRPRNFLV